MGVVSRTLPLDPMQTSDADLLHMAHSTGTLLCSGSSDRTAKVWDVPGGFCTHNFRGHTGIITLVRFHPNPRREVLFTAADDTTVRVWSLAKQSCLAVLRHHMSSVTGMGLSEDGSTLAMVGRDQILSVWDVESDAVPLLGSMPVYDTMEGLAVLTGEAAKALVPTYGEDTAHQHHQKSGKSRKRPLGGEGHTRNCRSPKVLPHIRAERLFIHCVDQVRSSGKESWQWLVRRA